LINAFAIKIFIMKPFITIAIFFALCSFFAACKKTQTQSPVCRSVQLRDGIVKCNGKFRRPTLGTIYYKNVPREFLTYGKDHQCYEPTYIDSLGNVQRITWYPVMVTYGIYSLYKDSSAVPGSCNSPFYVTPVTNSGSNWYDSCTGTLYLHYTWKNTPQQTSSLDVCDTCYF
jgi:hypothetical protein